jgi:NCS2 family nucleobase:cation symporter-2
MRKPADVVYGVDEIPPVAVSVVTGVQHVAVMSVYLVFPVLLAQAAGGSSDTAASMVSMTLVALAAATLLQATRVGSGFLCQPIPSVLYFVPSLTAVKHGGLALAFGMTLGAGLLEAVMAGVFRRLRALFPPEIAGLVVLLAGIATGMAGLRAALGGEAAGSQRDAVQIGLALGTLALMVALNVWGRGPLRLFCVLIGMAAGYAGAALLGMVGAADWAKVAAAPVLALPGVAHLDWRFEAALAVPFVIAATAATLKTMGNVATSQKINDAEWVRAELRSVARGIRADGLGAALGGALGAHGLNSSTSAVGLASATGVSSRRVAWFIAAMLLALAFVPKLGLVFSLMPPPVSGATLVFASTFIVVNGVEIIASRLLDARRTLVIGLSVVFGLAVEMYPGLLRVLPAGAELALGTSVVFGTLVGLALNGLFRIGVRRRVAMTLPAGAFDPRALDQWLERQAHAWGARRDVSERAKFNLMQSIETLVTSGLADGPIEVEAAFDEFRLDVRVSYDGEPLDLPVERPSDDEILASAGGERRLAGYMLRRLADRVSATRRGRRTTILFHFEH